MDNDTLSTLYDLIQRRKDPDDDIEWADVTEYISNVTGEQVSRDTVRKGAYLLNLFDEADWVRPPGDDTGAIYSAQRLEAESALSRLRDERNAISRIQRELSRRDTFLSLVREVMCEEIAPMDGYVEHHHEAGPCDLIVHLTDIHAGLEVHNCFNEYSDVIMRDRLAAYIDKIRDIARTHDAEVCYLLLGGDMISGHIHQTLRIENGVNVIRQVKMVSEAISWFVRDLSYMFKRVEVYAVPGNHSRIKADKKENEKGDYLDLLIPFYVSARMQNYKNVCVHDENMDDTVAMFHVRGMNVFGVHGDKDNMDSVVQKLTMVWGVKPDIVLAGHRHTNGMRTVYDTRVYESGCLSGPDDYCMDKRLRNRPEQTVLVVTSDGADCAYNVVFS